MPAPQAHEVFGAPVPSVSTAHLSPALINVLFPIVPLSHAHTSHFRSCVTFWSQTSHSFAQKLPQFIIIIDKRCPENFMDKLPSVKLAVGIMLPSLPSSNSSACGTACLLNAWMGGHHCCLVYDHVDSLHEAAPGTQRTLGLCAMDIIMGSVNLYNPSN